MNSSPRILLSLLLLIAAGGQSAGAQENAPAPGTRVRVHHRVNSVRPFSGVFVHLTPDSLYLVPDRSTSPEPIALVDIRRLQRSRGERSNLWRGALIGGIVGGVAGVGVGIAEPTIEQGAEESALVPIALGAIGAVAGGVAGGLIGSLSRSERWEPMVWGGTTTGIGIGLRYGTGSRISP